MIRVDLIFLFLLWLGCSCHRSVSPVDSRLEQAEALMTLCPDSSMAILDSIDQKQLTSSHQHALYALLYSEAGNKTYRSFTSDSLISIATNYFDRTTDHDRRGRAWYYRGIVYYELDSLAAALYCFEKAIEGGEKSQNNRLLMLCHARRRDIYSIQDMTALSIEEAQLALAYGVAANDSLNLPYLYWNLACQFDTKRHDSISLWAQKGIELATKTNNRDALSSLYGTMAANSYNKKDYQQTINYCNLAVEYSDSLDPYLLFVKGSVYTDLKEFDSANFYLNDARPRANAYLRESILEKLSTLKEKEGDLIQALHYKRQHEQLTDSLINDSQKNKVIQSTVEITKQRVSTHYEHRFTQRQLVFAALSGLMLTIALICWRKYRNYRKRSTRNFELFAQTRQQLEEHKHGLQKTAYAIDTLRLRLLQEQAGKEELQAQIDRLELQRERVEIVIARTESQMEQFKNSSFYVWLVQRLDNGTTSISKDELHNLRQALNLYFDNFTHRLSAQFPQLTPDEVNLCCLEKIGIPTKMIANIVHMTPNAVSRKKQQILSRKLQADQTVDKLSEFLSIY